jgi:hypothetical protein
MPQLDNVTYLSQIFWCFITFTSLYFILLKKILPHIAKILKLRKKLINNYKELFVNLNNINNNYTIYKSNDLIEILSLNTKKITELNNSYNSINSDSYVQNYIKNYTVYSIISKMSKIILNKNNKKAN